MSYLRSRLLILLVLFVLQLKYSSSARTMLKQVVERSAFGLTSFGLVGVLVLISLKKMMS